MGARVLVVEDEPAIADFLVRGLREEGFAVERAGDGDAALAALRSAPWDVVLLDWRIPGPDGVEVLRRFRRLEPDTPVLFLTARDAVSDRVRGLNAGADDYLCKPFAFSELLARVRALTRRAAPRGDVFRHGDLTLDLATRRVERSGKPVELTAREESLLALFMRRPGEVLTRTVIYENVWDEHYDGLSNTLEVHVMELRRKLEAHGPRLIHTLRGRGYYLGDPLPGTEGP
jgi:two-component system copper resistance phosphate regulon response regulator CusR